METEKATFYGSWVRWEGKDRYALWIDTPDKEFYWTDSQGRIPFFSTKDEVVTLAAKLGVQVYVEKLIMHDLDLVRQWLQQTQKLPPKESLAIWGMFSDVGTGVGNLFDGDRKSPVRNRVFDKLYLNDGIIQINQEGRMEFRNATTKPWIPRWRLQERKMLKRCLQQGFRLWQKYTYPATIDMVPLP
ncbi:hypothetical protein [Hymenobacter defluvii]|uniref:Uncharacterized protein n=1 Tax=Hymenobacter defluvii TaxID=2054411 RepID=A0ABS3T5X9_9BACT|nr:hypothetical protein [Hymenobacter defluvii]MBO3269041.1 hypothetical protein [Hymenobacter defluvii]